MSQKLLFILILLLFSAGHINSQNLFFSEFSPLGTSSVLEIYNPEKDTLDLTGYTVRLSFNGYPFPSISTDNKYFDLSGYAINPGETFVFACKDAPNEAKIVADVILDDGTSPGQYILHFFNDDALGLFKNDSLIDLIGKESQRVVWDVAGVTAVTAHNTNGAKTMIRKPFIARGNTDWDKARGYSFPENSTFADSAEWLVYDAFFSDLKKHSFISPDSAVIWSDEFEISASVGEKDTIYFVPVNTTGNELLTKISAMPGVKIELFRSSAPLDKSEKLKKLDELVVWNSNETKFHTYVIWPGNYNYVNESVIISELLYAEMLRAIEIYNPTSKPANLRGWGIGKDGAVNTGGITEYTAFPEGLTLQPGETFVLGYIYDVSTAVPSSSVTSYAEHILPYFDMYEKGAANLNVLSNINFTTSLALLDQDNRVIDLFQPGKIAATIDGMTMAFNMASLVRRAYINHGEPDWNYEKEAQKETSTWNWRPHTYLDLGKHNVYKADTAFVLSDIYQVSNGGENDSIFPVKSNITVAELLKNIKKEKVWTVQISHEGSILGEEQIIPEGSKLDVISTDLSYIKTYKLSFGKNDLQISSPEMNIEADTLFCSDLYMTSSRLMEKLSPPERGWMQVVNGIGNARSGYLNHGDRILITAEDLTQKYYYINFKFPENYSIIRSPFYLVDTLLNTIYGIAEEEDPELVKSKIIIASGQKIEIINNEGQATASISSGNILRITAKNGSIRNYSIITFQTSPSKQVWAEPTITNMPPGLTRSEVYLRTLRPHTLSSYPGPVNPESGKPWETLDALKGFHCTQLRWVTSTIGPVNFIPSIQNSGFRYQGAVNTHGSLLADDNHFEPLVPPRREMVCPNKPGTAREYFKLLRKYISMGSDGQTFHSDGGRWLMEGDFDDMFICYCKYCNAKRSALGITSPTSTEGKRFMLNSMLELLDTVHTHFEDSLGYKIEWSANNSSRHVHNELIANGYTTAYGEVDAREYYSTPAKWIEDFRTAERNGIMQIFQICSHNVDNDIRADDVLNTRQYDKFVCVNRAHYAFAYAAGGMASVPWDSYTGDNQTRHFGLLSEFADLSGFIRGMSRYLDGYESGYDYFRANGQHTGTSYTDKRFNDSNATVLVEGNDNAAVFVRIRPGDEEAPIMVHLTEWFHIYESNEYYVPYKFKTRASYTLKLRKSAFFNGSPFSIKLLTPMPYRREAHEMSQLLSDALLIPGEYRSSKETSAYQNLVREEYLEFRMDGDFVILEIPVLPHYGVLKLEKALSKPAILSSSRYQVCDETIYIPGPLKVETLLSSIQLSEQSTMMVQDSLGFNKNSGMVTEDDKLAVLSEDQSCRLYTLTFTENRDSMIIKHNGSEILLNEVINLGKIPVIPDTELNFVIINTASDNILLSELSCNLDFLVISSNKSEISPGDSAIISVKMNDQEPGKYWGNIKIAGDRCNQLPFHFQIMAEIVAADILVRYQGKELNEGSILNYGTAGMGEELFKSLTIVNYGKGELVVSEIGSESDNVFIRPRNLSLKPAESANVEVRLSISGLDDQGSTLFIRSNSYGPDSLLSFVIQAIGKDVLMTVKKDTKELIQGDTLDFGEITVNSSTTMMLQITNNGNDILNITGIRNESGYLGISASEVGIMPGGTLILEVNYSPQALEQLFDSIMISSNAFQKQEFKVYFKGEALITGRENYFSIPGPVIFPNPFRDKLFMENIIDYFLLKLVNMEGKIILERNIDNITEFEIDTSGLGRGLYSLIFVGEEHVETIKILKK
jgi:hypothetical protein